MTEEEKFELQYDCQPFGLTSADLSTFFTRELVQETFEKLIESDLTVAEKYELLCDLVKNCIDYNSIKTFEELVEPCKTIVSDKNIYNDDLPF